MKISVIVAYSSPESHFTFNYIISKLAAIQVSLQTRKHEKEDPSNLVKSLNVQNLIKNET